MIVLRLVCKGKIIFSVLKYTKYLQSSVQEEGILEHTNGKCHLCTL